eukprot:403368446
MYSASHGYSGILCLIADRKAHSKFLRLYDINTSDLLFQTELYVNFDEKYLELNDYFYSFPLEKVHIGIQFANVHDASVFRNLIHTYSFKGDKVEEVLMEHKSKLGISAVQITKPLVFQRKEHAGWDPSTQTFILNEVPREIKQLLKKAGFKKKHLKKKEIALAIYEELLRGIEFDSIKSQVKLAVGRTNSNNQDFISNRMSGEDSRMMINERTNSVMNFGLNQLSTQNNMGMLGANLMSQNYLDPKQHKASILMNNLGHHILNTTAARANSHINVSPDGKQDEGRIARPPPLAPPLMGMIPPPPMNIPPPNVGMMGIPQPPGPNLQNTPGSQQNVAISFNEQLIMQSQNLKKVQEKEINSKVKNMSESQQLKITQNLAAVLENRRQLLHGGNTNNNGGDSDEESNDEGNNSDDSAW